MKKLAILLLLLFCAAPAFAQEDIYPWTLTVFGGAQTYCVKSTGCPSGYTFGGSFGRGMSRNWSFELEGSYAYVREDLGLRFDLPSNQYYILELDRTRIYGGGTFFGSMARFGRSDIFIAAGFVAAFERQQEISPPNIFHQPTKDLGLKGGLSAGSGLNWWFSDSWGIRPEARFYFVPDLGGLRYSVGLSHRF